MNAIAELLYRDGLWLLAGSSVLLAAGAFIVKWRTAPIERQRVAELAVGAVLVWLILVYLPLPRYSLGVIEAPAPAPARKQLDPVTELQRRSTASAPTSNAARDGSWETSSVSPRGPATALATVEPHAPASSPVEGEPVTASASPIPPHLATRDRNRKARWQRFESSKPSALPPPVFRSEGWTSKISQSAKHVGQIAKHLGRSVPAIYLIGAGLWVLWLAMGRFLLWRILSSATAPPSWVAELVRAELPPAARMPRLLASRHCSRPLTCGVWRATIVLPLNFCQAGHHARLVHVLRHELVHVQKRDAWGHQLFHLALPLLYFHPLYWYLRSTAQFCRELLADDWAARRSTPENYAAQLIEWVKGRQSCKAPLEGALGLLIFSSTNQFYRRMTMLLDRNEPLATRCGRTWHLTSVAAVFALVSAVWFLGPPAGAAGSQDVPVKDQDAPAKDEPLKDEPVKDQDEPLKDEPLKDAPVKDQDAPDKESVPTKTQDPTPEQTALLGFAKKLSQAYLDRFGKMPDELSTIEAKILEAQDDAAYADLKAHLAKLHDGLKSSEPAPEKKGDKSITKKDANLVVGIFELLKRLEELEDRCMELYGEVPPSLSELKQSLQERAKMAPDKGDPFVKSAKFFDRRSKKSDKASDNAKLQELRAMQALKALKEFEREQERNTNDAKLQDRQAREAFKQAQEAAVQAAKQSAMEAKMMAMEAELAARKKQGEIPESRGSDQTSDLDRASGMQLDLVQLADTYSDALSDAEASRIRLDELVRVNTVAPGAASDSQNALAKAAAKAAERKVKLLRGMVEVALEASETELAMYRASEERASQLVEKGFADATQVGEMRARRARCEAHTRILKLMLEE